MRRVLAGVWRLLKTIQCLYQSTRSYLIMSSLATDPEKGISSLSLLWCPAYLTTHQSITTVAFSTNPQPLLCICEDILIFIVTTDNICVLPAAISHSIRLYLGKCSPESSKYTNPSPDDHKPALNRSVQAVHSARLERHILICWQ
jgi:hypothetical protein